MNKRAKIALFFILLTIFASIDQPIPDISEARSRKMKDQFPAAFTCLANHLPNGVPVLYFSETDGTLSWDKEIEGEYFQMQYVLAPRLLIVFRDRPANFEEYDWFIAHWMDEKVLNRLISDQGLTIVQTCGREVILQRATG